MMENGHGFAAVHSPEPFMLRITTQFRAVSVQRYFVELLCKDDYYNKGTEQPGIWRGKGAVLLGLEDNVEREAFARLVENRHPTNDKRLTPRTKDGRRVGYDFTFSPPKSVSVVYAITKDPDVLWAFRQSVRETMAEIEEMVQTRVRIRGANHDRSTGNMVWAEYQHFTTRPVDGEPDVHLHSHNFVANCTYDKDEQRWKAIQLGEVTRNAPYFQTVALSRLAANLVKVGYQVERTEHAFEVVGVSPEAINEFSRRKHIIESIASELGFEQERKASLGAKTRERKTDRFTLDELHERWTARLSEEEVSTIRGLKGTSPEQRPSAEHEPSSERPRVTTEAEQRPTPEREPRVENESTPETEPDAEEKTKQQEEPSREDEPKAEHTRRSRWGPHLFASLSASDAVRAAITDLFKRDAIVEESKLVQRALKFSFGRAEKEQVSDAIDRLPELIRRKLGDKTYFTTHEAVAEERELVRFAKAGRNSVRPFGTRPLSRSVPKLDDYERGVLEKLLGSTDRLILFKNTGPTRKPELVRAAMTGAQQAGYSLVVITPTAASARQAEKDYGITDVKTVARILNGGEYTSGLKNLLPKAMKPVFWVEDAGRIGMRTIAKLAAAAERCGARIVLSGDEARSRKYERGDPFRLLREEAGLSSAERRVLRDRQNDLERSVDALQHDGGRSAVQTLDELGKLSVAPDDESPLEHAAEFLTAWEVKGKKALLVTPTIEEANALTDVVRQKLRSAGRLEKKDHSVLQLVSAGLSDAEMRRAAFYTRGMVVDFYRPTRGFASGDRTRVIGTDPVNGVWVLGKLGTPVRLNLSHADRFTVSRAQRTKLSVGDRIRVTRQVRPLIGKPIKAGSVVTVTGVNPFGQIAVSGLRLLPKKFGHFEHDYVTTPGRIQGRRAEATAFVADRFGWGRAESRDILAAGEAARKDFRLFVNDMESLTSAITRERPVMNAVDLIDDPEYVEMKMEDHAFGFEQMKRDDLGGFRYGS